MSGAVMGTHRALLEGFDTAKGTIRFAPARPLPADLVASIVHDRMTEIDAAPSSRR